MRLFTGLSLFFALVCVFDIIDCRSIPSANKNRHPVYRQAAFTSPHQLLPYHRSNHNSYPIRSLTHSRRLNTNRNRNVDFSAPRAFLSDGYANSFLNSMECLTPTNARGFCSTLRQCVPNFFTEEGELKAPALAELISFNMGSCNASLPTITESRRYKKFSTVGDRIMCCPGTYRGLTKKTKSETAAETNADQLNESPSRSVENSSVDKDKVSKEGQSGKVSSPVNEEANLNSNEKFSVQLLTAKKDGSDSNIEQLNPEVYSATDASAVIKISPEPVVGANGKFTVGNNGVLIERLTTPTPKPGPASFSEKLSEVDSVPSINIKSEANLDSNPVLIASVEELPQVQYSVKSKTPKFSSKIASLTLDKSVGSDELDEVAMRQAKISIIVEDLSGESREYARLKESWHPENRNNFLPPKIAYNVGLPQYQPQKDDAAPIHQSTTNEVKTTMIPQLQNDMFDIENDLPLTTTVFPLENVQNDEPVHGSTVSPAEHETEVVFRDEIQTTTELNPIFDSPANENQSTTQREPLSDDVARTTEAEHLFDTVSEYQSTTKGSPKSYSSATNDYQNVTEDQPVFDSVTNQNLYTNTTEAAPSFYSAANNEQQSTTQAEPNFDFEAQDQGTTESEPLFDFVSNDQQVTTAESAPIPDVTKILTTTVEPVPIYDDKIATEPVHESKVTTDSAPIPDSKITTNPVPSPDDKISTYSTAIPDPKITNDEIPFSDDKITTFSTPILESKVTTDEIPFSDDKITTYSTPILNTKVTTDPIPFSDEKITTYATPISEDTKLTTESVAQSVPNANDNENINADIPHSDSVAEESQATTESIPQKNRDDVSVGIADDEIGTTQSATTVSQLNDIPGNQKSQVSETTIQTNTQNGETIRETTTPQNTPGDNDENIANDNSGQSETNPSRTKDAGDITNGLVKPSSGVIKIANSAEGINQSEENPLYTSYEKAQEDFSYSHESFSSDEKSDLAKVKGFIPAYTVIKPSVKLSPFNSLKERKPILQVSSINNKNLGQFHTLHEDDSLENNSEDFEYSPRLPVGQIFLKQESLGKNKVSVNGKADTESEEEFDEFEEKIYFQNAGGYPNNSQTSTTTTQSSVDDVPSPITITSVPIQVDSTRPSTSIVMGQPSTASTTPANEDLHTTKVTEAAPSATPDTVISTPEDDSSEFEDQPQVPIETSSTTTTTTTSTTTPTTVETTTTPTTTVSTTTPTPTTTVSTTTTTPTTVSTTSNPDFQVNHPVTSEDVPEEINHSSTTTTTQANQISSSPGTEISSEATTKGTSTSKVSPTTDSISSSSTIGSTESATEPISTSTSTQSSLSSISTASSTDAATQNATEGNPVTTNATPEDIPTTQQIPSDTAIETTTTPPVEPEQIQITDRPAVAPPEYKILAACKNQDYFRGLQEPEQNHYPWLATVVGGTRPFCSATLITNQHVLTAAHFLSNITVSDVYHMRVHIGYRASENGPTMGPYAVRKVIKVVRHKGFSFEKLYNDIAILILDRPVHFNDNISPVCLASGKTNYTDGKTDAIETGWTEDPPTKHISPHHPFIDPQIQKYFSFGYKNVTWSLKESMNRVRTNEECRANYGFLERNGITITKSMVCAGSPEGTACGFRGNSGAPLFVPNEGRPEQIGIVSWGIGCGHFPSVFTRVSAFIPWIERVVFHTR